MPVLPVFVGKHDFDLLHVRMEISVADLGKLGCV